VAYGTFELNSAADAVPEGLPFLSLEADDPLQLNFFLITFN
jgi:hypothetical protein